jgi:uncharacterized membrane protein
MLFAHPHWLWLLPVSALLAALDWRRGVRRRVTTLLRGTCAAALVLALACPFILLKIDKKIVIVVIDLGAPAGDDALAKARDFTASLRNEAVFVVPFSSRARVLTEPSTLDDPKKIAVLRQSLSRAQWPDDLPRGSCNLADALRLAGTRIPADGRGEIHLFATGRNDHGDAAIESWRLAQRGIAVFPGAVHETRNAPFCIKSVSLPATARVGQSVRATLTLNSLITSRVTISLTAADARTQLGSADVVPGLNEIVLPLTLANAGLNPIQTAAWMSKDSPPPAVVRAAVEVNSATRVLLVRDQPNAGAGEAFRNILGSAATIETVQADELTAARLKQFDAVILDDLPAGRLSSDVQNALRDAVISGTGLLVTGAERSFGPGGYESSQLASLLPVRMPDQMQSLTPSTALVLIIDTSGSMQGPRIDLAKEVARLALSHLHPQDKAGIVEFYGGRRWAAPIQSMANAAAMHRALDRLTAGGSTVLYPAVEEAAFALRNVRARSKHVLICSDGFVEDTPFDGLVRQMADDGIVVSTVQVTASSDGPNLMPDIARWGNGRFYIVPDEYALPDLTFKQPTLLPQSPISQVPISVSAGDDPLLLTIASHDFGTVGGYVRTQAKSTADVLLNVSGGEPLLARWRYGAGFVAALPTQLGSTMTAGLQNRPEFSKLMANLFRQIGTGHGSSLRVTTDARPAGVEADVQLAVADPVLSADEITVALLDSAGHRVRTTTANAISAGHWNVLFPDVTAGAYTIEASLPGTSLEAKAGVAVSPPDPAVSADGQLLEKIGGFAALAGQRAAMTADHPRPVAMQNLLAVIAVVLLLTHVAVRRWPVQGWAG